MHEGKEHHLDGNNLHSNRLHKIPCHIPDYFHHIEMALDYDKLEDREHPLVGRNLPSNIHAYQFPYHKLDDLHHIVKAYEKNIHVDKVYHLADRNLPSSIHAYHFHCHIWYC